MSALPGQRVCAECMALGVPLLPEPVVMVECLRCGGSGEARSEGVSDWRGAAGLSGRRCRDCGGSGAVSDSQRASQEVLAGAALEAEPLVECPACDGGGCRFCGDSGKVRVDKAEQIADLLG